MRQDESKFISLVSVVCQNEMKIKPKQRTCGSPSLKLFKARLYMAWSILFKWKVFLIIFKVPPNPDHSVTVSFALGAVGCTKSPFKD